MSHPDPCYDPDNSYEDDEMVSGMDENWDVDETEYETYDDEEDANYDDYNDFHEEDDDYNDSMDGDHDSAMRDAGFGTDEDYGHYGDDIDAFHDYYGEDY